MLHPSVRSRVDTLEIVGGLLEETEERSGGDERVEDVKDGDRGSD